jgi:uncharacterized membrane protein YjdF
MEQLGTTWLENVCGCYMVVTLLLYANNRFVLVSRFFLLLLSCLELDLVAPGIDIRFM